MKTANKNSFEIDRQIMWDRLIAIVEEQAQTIIRTAFSSAVTDAGDLSAGVFDTKGRMLAQAVTGTPGHVNAMAQSVAHFLERYPLLKMSNGDVYITNDPWLATGHLHDFTVVTPIFFESTAVALFASTCHVVDIGGRGFGADAEELYEEGLQIPILALFTKGNLNADLMTLIRENVREPLLVEGDLYSLVASNERGGIRLCEMLKEYDGQSLTQLGNWIIETSHEAMCKAIMALPAGTYSHSTRIDGYDEPLCLSAQMMIESEQIVVEMAGTSEQSKFGINVPLPYTQAYISYGIRCIVGAGIPNNAGSLAPIKITAPASCLLNAKRPAPVSARGVIGHLLPDLILGCLDKAIPGLALAESASCIWGPMIYGDSDDKKFVLVNAHAGGMGARKTQDGLSTTGFPSGVRCTPIEVTESVSPIVIWRKELLKDSGGAGRYRGGLGQIMEYGHKAGLPFILSAMFERVDNPAAGRNGGDMGAPGQVYTNSGRSLKGKGRQSIKKNETLILEMPGGGGYGAAFSRAADQVAEDVLADLVSVDAAHQKYGVSLDEEGRVDETRTQKLRSNNKK
jgi:N-methylhydantoinase B